MNEETENQLLSLKRGMKDSIQLRMISLWTLFSIIDFDLSLLFSTLTRL